MTGSHPLELCLVCDLLVLWVVYVTAGCYGNVNTAQKKNGNRVVYCTAGFGGIVQLSNSVIILFSNSGWGN